MDNKPKVITISEVKPKNFKLERFLSEYNIDGYEMIPLNLNKGDPGRGMILYIDSNLKYTPITVNGAYQEYICIEIQLKGNDRFLVASVYRSPSCENINNENLNNFLKLLNSMDYSHLLIFGDMNFPNIDWVNITTDRGPGDIKYEFLETIRDCFLHQNITEPTRGRGDAKPSTIDLLFSNEEGMVTDVNIEPPLGKSDHSVINFKFNGYLANSNCDKTRYKYDKADYVNMKKYLDID